MSERMNFRTFALPQTGTRLKWSRSWLLCLALAPLIAGIAHAQTAQTITITAVTNSADFRPGFPQKGSLASIFTTGLQGAPGIYQSPSWSITLSPTY